MDIPRRFFMHLKSGIAVCEQRVLIFNGNHVFLNGYRIVISAVNFDIARS